MEIGAPVSSQQRSRGLWGLAGAEPRKIGTSSRATGKLTPATKTWRIDQSTAVESDKEGDAMVSAEFQQLPDAGPIRPRVLPPALWRCWRRQRRDWVGADRRLIPACCE